MAKFKGLFIGILIFVLTFTLSKVMAQTEYYDVIRIQNCLLNNNLDSKQKLVMAPKNDNCAIELAQTLLPYLNFDVKNDTVIPAFEEKYFELEEAKKKLESIKEIRDLRKDSLTREKGMVIKDTLLINNLQSELNQDSLTIKKKELEIEKISEEVSNRSKAYYNKVRLLWGINPFIGLAAYNQEHDVIPSKYNVFNRTLNNLSGLDVTTFAQGLSQFMIERAKAELNAAFFERFKKFAEDNDEIGLLFPVTTNRLSNLLSFQYTEMISQLRDAFYEDLNNLPDNMITFLQESDDFEYLREHNPDFLIAIECFKLVRELDYLSPPDFIAQLPSIVTDSVKAVAARVHAVNRVTNFKAVLQLASIFSESVRDTSDSRNWVSSTEFKKNILDDPIAFQIYLGLVYQRIKTDSVKIGSEKLAEIIRRQDIKKEILWYTNRVTELVYLANKVDYSYKEIKSLNEDDKKVGNEQVYSYINTTIEIAEFGNKFIEQYADYETYKKFNDYLSITQNANDIYRYIYQKEYGSAINSTADLFDKIYPYQKVDINSVKAHYEVSDEVLKNYLNKEDRAQKKKIIEPNDLQNTIGKHKIRRSDRIVSRSIKDERKVKRKDTLYISKSSTVKMDTTLVYAMLQKELSIRVQANDWVEDFRKYGTFMANMVEAETPEDVANIIEATALPVGSSSIKKNSNWNLAVNGYLGASRRVYFDKKNKKVSNNAWNSKLAVSAPVGITFSHGFGNGKGPSLSLMAVILDVGAIVDYQLTSDSSNAKIESKITLGNIFSPGGYIVLGAPWNLPISLGIGGQYGPGLSSVSSVDNTTVVNEPNWRWGAFLAVDIPMFNILNVSKR